MLKKTIKSLTNTFGFEVRRSRVHFDGAHVPNADLYRPLFSPWLGISAFRRYYDRAAPRTLVSADRCHVLYTLLQQAMHLDGDVWECGVFRGGTAAMMASMLKDQCPEKRLCLFDTFEGMPQTDAARDLHEAGDFAGTSLESVIAYVDCPELCVFHKGVIPNTFAGLESARIALAHIDVDIYKSIIDCLNFIWPRLTVGGFLVFDDYGFPTCPGARAAVDDFFRAKKCRPLCLPTGQAVVFKSISG